MGRRAKPAKAKVEAKRPPARKSRKNEGSRIHDLEKSLAEALARETATSEILRVIASSPSDVQPVFDAIALAAMRLSGSTIGVVTRYDGEFLHLAAHSHHAFPEAVEMVRRIFPSRPSRALLHGRVVLDRAVVHMPDVQAEAEYRQSIATAFRARSSLGVPMLLDGRVVGVIAVARVELRPFKEAEITLLQTFADQAVIAIENVRLFTELQTSNRDLTMALEQQTATADILIELSEPMRADLAEFVHDHHRYGSRRRLSARVEWLPAHGRVSVRGGV